MATNHVETPGIPSGNEKQQLEQMFRYLSRLADDLNVNLDAIGGNELNDEERMVMQQILAKAAEDAGIPEEDAAARAGQEMESLKSLIIKTASFVQTRLDEMRTNLIGETVAEGKFGKYVRRTGLDMVVTPEGVTQNYTLQDIVTGLSSYEVNAKNYIKTGLLRTVSSIPVYGVAVGKDVVTFTQDGQEIYNDGNKVAELTADELSFYQSGSKIASYTGSGISFFINNEKLMEIKPAEIGFYYSGNKVFYISNGKIYSAGDMEITANKKLIISSGVLDVDTTNFKIDSANKRVQAGNFVIDDKSFRIDKVQNLPHVSNVHTYFVVGDKDTYDYSSQGFYTGILFDNELYEGHTGSTYFAAILPVISFFANNENNAKLFNLKIESTSVTRTSIYDNTVGSSKSTDLGTLTYPFANLFINILNACGTNPAVGSSSAPFTNAYITNLYATYVGSASTPVIFTATSGSCGTLKPSSGNGTGSVGDSSTYYANAYINTLTASLLSPKGGNNQGSIGTTGIRWNQAFINYLYGTDIGSISSAFSNVYSSAVKGNTINPIYGDDTGTIGQNGTAWKEAYINTVHTTSQYQISSRERKHSIEPMKPPGDRLDQLKPVTFVYNDDRDERTRQGLIYEDTVEVMPEICTDPEKEGKAINYTELIPMLLKEIQELRARVKTLEEGR